MKAIVRLIIGCLLYGQCLAADYEITDLGTLGQASSMARGINNAGQVVGWAQTAQGDHHACIWSPKVGAFKFAHGAVYFDNFTSGMPLSGSAGSFWSTDKDGYWHQEYMGGFITPSINYTGRHGGANFKRQLSKQCLCYGRQ